MCFWVLDARTWCIGTFRRISGLPPERLGLTLSPTAVSVSPPPFVQWRDEPVRKSAPLWIVCIVGALILAVVGGVIIQNQGGDAFRTVPELEPGRIPCQREQPAAATTTRSKGSSPSRSMLFARAERTAVFRGGERFRRGRMDLTRVGAAGLELPQLSERPALHAFCWKSATPASSSARKIAEKLTVPVPPHETSSLSRCVCSQLWPCAATRCSDSCAGSRLATARHKTRHPPPAAPALGRPAAPAIVQQPRRWTLEQQFPGQGHALPRSSGRGASVGTASTGTSTTTAFSTRGSRSTSTPRPRAAMPTCVIARMVKSIIDKLSPYHLSPGFAGRGVPDAAAGIELRRPTPTSAMPWRRASTACGKPAGKTQRLVRANDALEQERRAVQWNARDEHRQHDPRSHRTQGQSRREAGAMGQVSRR